jgi:hypothetical protein
MKKKIMEKKTKQKKMITCFAQYPENKISWREKKETK